MPEEWQSIIEELGSTLATIAPYQGAYAALYESEDGWERDTVHRWAHVMQAQPRGTVHRYSPTAHRSWRPR